MVIDQKAFSTPEEEQAARDQAGIQAFDELYAMSPLVRKRFAEAGEDSIEGKFGTYTRLGEYVYSHGYDYYGIPRLHLRRVRTDKTPAQVRYEYEKRPQLPKVLTVKILNADHSKYYWDEEIAVVDNTYPHGKKVIDFRAKDEFREVTKGGIVYREPFENTSYAIARAREFIVGLLTDEPTAGRAGL
jgi:hypothetical protein